MEPEVHAAPSIAIFTRLVIIVNTQKVQSSFSVDGIMPPKLKFAEGEKVLCYHGPLLYEAKVRCYTLQHGRAIQ